MMKEVWKDIDFTQGKYSVSNLGRVRCNGFMSPIGSNQRIVKPKIKKPGVMNNGYFNVSIFRKTHLVHRLVAKAFLSVDKDKKFVNHKNGLKNDNRVENLEWCTRQENENHAYSTGLKNSTGSSNTMSKLTEEKVKEIKLLDHKNATKVGQKYGVHRATIQRIWNNKIWTHI